MMKVHEHVLKNLIYNGNLTVIQYSCCKAADFMID